MCWLAGGMLQAHGREGSRPASPHPDTVASLVTSCQAGQGGVAINRGVPVEGRLAGVCDPTGIRGEGPLSQAQLPPRRAMFGWKTLGRDPSASPRPYSEGPALGRFRALCRAGEPTGHVLGPRPVHWVRPRWALQGHAGHFSWAWDPRLRPSSYSASSPHPGPWEKLAKAS